MIPLDEFRKLEPEFAAMTDDELTKIRNMLYQLANLTLENFFEDKSGSKYPAGLLTSPEPVRKLSDENHE